MHNNFVEDLTSDLREKVRGLKSYLDTRLYPLCHVIYSLAGEMPSVVVTNLIALALLDARHIDYLMRNQRGV